MKEGKKLKETWVTKLLHNMVRLGKAALVELDLLRDPHAPVFSQKMAKVYLFGRPELYFKIIDYLIMLISFYMALWLCNFAVSTDAFPPNIRETWKVYSLLPGLISFSMYSYVIRASAFLRVRVVLYPTLTNLLYNPLGRKS